METCTIDHSGALSALAAKRQAEVQIARAANCPPWRHGVFGVLMGGLVATPAFDLWVRFAILVALLASVVIIIQADRRRMGMFINGYRRGRTRVVALAMLAVELSLYMISIYYGLVLNNHVIPLVLGAVAIPVAIPVGIGGSIIWQRVFVREMGA